MTDKTAPIGVTDSGVGGVSVLKELIKLMPNENYFYFGDNKNAPYGTKTAEDVKKIMETSAEYIISQGVKALVIACNTATAAAAKTLRKKYPSIPIIGIEPAIKPSAKYKEHSNVVVMATPLTLKQEKFHDLMDKFSDEANITPLPCPGLMELVEAGEIKGEKIDNYLKEIFAPLSLKKIDSVVLGCTHYPHIKEAVQKLLGSDIMIFDGGEGTAKETKRRLAGINMLNPSEQSGKLVIECSDKKHDIKPLVIKLLEKNDIIVL